MNRMRSAAWKALMEQATGGEGGDGAAGGSGGDAAAAAAAAAAAGNTAGATGDDGKQKTGDDGKPAGSEAGADGGKGGENGKPAGESKAPESYTLTLPEKSSLTQSDVDKVAAFAKANNLSNDAAQAVLVQRHDAAKQVTDAATAKLTETKTAWLSELKADAEFGGAALDKNGELAANAIKAFGGDELLKSVMDAGFNLHPGFFRMMTRIGKAMSEDKPLNQPAGSGSGGAKDAATVLYGKPS